MIQCSISMKYIRESKLCVYPVTVVDALWRVAGADTSLTGGVTHLQQCYSCLCLIKIDVGYIRSEITVLINAKLKSWEL